MSDAIIRIENLSKQYAIGANSTDTLREQITNSLSSIFQRQAKKQEDNTIWALKDINLEVKTGEVLGLIGHNGAGKSTLLKILSRITHPTTGRIEMRGRVASLLEVGTGFHPELTGRENIFMNAAVLGMKRAETRRRFDEIVEFAEISQFIDTPVKRYSSGMYTRLAFAVAAHLEPEILIVDEVLSVGDIAFQKKSLGKMSDVASHGRTVLFVSHNLGAVANLCTRAVHLERGQVRFDGSVNKAIEDYLDIYRQQNQGERIWTDKKSAPSSSNVYLKSIRIINDGKITDSVDIQKDTSIEIEYCNETDGLHLMPVVTLKDKYGVVVLASTNMNSATLTPDKWYGTPMPKGLYKSTFVIPGNFLNNGTYNFDVYVQRDVNHNEVQLLDAMNFQVVDTGNMREEFMGEWAGVIRPRMNWNTEHIE